MNRRISILTVLGVAIFAAAATICYGQEIQPKSSPVPRSVAHAPPKIAKCPVTPSEDIDPEVFTEYEGKRIYFCCDRCRIKFLRDPAKYTAQLVSNSPAAEPTPEHSDEAHEHAHGDDAKSATDAHDDADNHHSEAGSMPAAHDHKEHGPSTGPRWQKWLGGFHPAMVNFPIGVLTAAAFAEFLFIVRRRQEFDHVARFCVIFAVVTGVAAGILGWLFAGIRLADTDPLLAIHRWLGTVTVLWLIGLLWASERAHRPEHPARGLYRFLLFGGTALVTLTGFFGGAMVYGLDHYLLR